MPQIQIQVDGHGQVVDVTGLPWDALFELIRELALDPDAAEQIEGQYEDPGDWIQGYSQRVSAEHMGEVWRQMVPEIRSACRSPYRPLPNLMLRNDVRLGLAANWQSPSSLVTVLRKKPGEQHVTPHPDNRLRTVAELGGDYVSAAAHFVEQVEQVVSVEYTDEASSEWPPGWRAFDAKPRTGVVDLPEAEEGEKPGR